MRAPPPLLARRTGNSNGVNRKDPRREQLFAPETGKEFALIRRACRALAEASPTCGEARSTAAIRRRYFGDALLNPKPCRRSRQVSRPSAPMARIARFVAPGLRGTAISVQKGVTAQPLNRKPQTAESRLRPQSPGSLCCARDENSAPRLLHESAGENVAKDDGFVVELVAGRVDERDAPLSRNRAELVQELGVPRQFAAIAATKLFPAVRIMAEPAAELRLGATSFSHRSTAASDLRNPAWPEAIDQDAHPSSGDGGR